MHGTLQKRIFAAILSGLVTAAAAGFTTPDSALPAPAAPMPDARIAAPEPPGFISFCIRFPDQCTRQKEAPLSLALTPDRWTTLERVNLAVNRAIVPMHDQEHYGRAEYWNIPSDGLGDCKDYALTKRQQLMAMGFPQPALRLAIVYTWKKERHAVLTVTTDRGDLVLDNVTDWIRNWDATDYQWVERQDPIGAGAGSPWSL